MSSREARFLGLEAFRFVKAVLTHFGTHEGTTYAAGIAYYALLSLFPILLAIVSLLGFFLESEFVRQQAVDFLASYLPQARDVIDINTIAVRDTRGPAGLIALGGFIWGGKAIFGAIGAGLNRVWNVSNQRPFWQRTLLEIALVLGTAVLLLLSMGIRTGLNLVRELGLPLGPFASLESRIWDVVVIGVSILLNTIVFALMYRYVPHRANRWRDLLPGAVFGAVAFELGKDIFLWYTVNFTNYAAVYGSLGAVVALLGWAYYSGCILLLGAEISAELARRRAAVATGPGVVLSGPTI